MNDMEQGQKSKHDYLTSMGWDSIEHPDGFKIYSHWRFPSKYKEGKAVEKMEESLDMQIKSVKIFKKDEEGLEELRKYLLPVFNPKRHEEEKILEAINKVLGIGMTIEQFQDFINKPML